MTARLGTDERPRLMFVHAHPDDESSKGAATMARYAREGADVLVVTCTGGERGDILNPAMDRPEIINDLPRVRREELATACAILGVRQVDLGFEDSGWVDPDAGADQPPPPEGCFAALPLEEASAPLVELIRRERPHVVVTYDENGGYPHPDHVRCHEISIAAVDSAADAAHEAPGEPWAVPKVYYVVGWHKDKLQAVHEALLQRGLESPYTEWLEKWVDEPDQADRVTTRVPCAEYYPLRNDALVAHATQVDPAGSWFAVPLDLQQEVWPTEDYQLARSTVDSDVPEDDLLAGLRPRP
jgi:mycothiol S-conjugate amidase